MIPPLARKIAHYWYSDGNELAVFVNRRKYYIRDAITGEYPFDPEHGAFSPHPSEGTEASDASYETLGLYYGYEMAGTGWSGDC